MTKLPMTVLGLLVLVTPVAADGGMPFKAAIAQREPTAAETVDAANGDSLLQNQFLDWLWGRGGHPPGAGRGEPLITRGGFCVVVPATNEGVMETWSDRPVFVTNIGHGGLEVISQADSELIWSHLPTQESFVRYEGQPLQRGETYIARISNPLLSRSAPREIRFKVLAETQAIEQDLEQLEAELIAAGETVESLVLKRADYFWEQGLIADAWRELVTIQSVSPTAAMAVDSGLTRLCNLNEE
ncbi:MAG: hypothetical protein F6K04_22045 [Leptolyngbya sp. SIO4C5]|nr:hypothetical protein [Leptolyngbya sp. SIO4C5]